MFELLFDKTELLCLNPNMNIMKYIDWRIQMEFIAVSLDVTFLLRNFILVYYFFIL